MPSYKLYYFAGAGRAEVTRVLFNVGGVAFEDYRFAFPDWAELKKKMPMGQVPVLEVDGKMLCQSAAIERYVAKVTGLTPADPWEAAKIEETSCFVQEIGDLLMGTMSIKDVEAKKAARAELIAGAMKDKFTKLTAMVEAHGNKFLCGDKLTTADIYAFVFMSSLVSGFFDGIPADLFNDYPTLKAYHARVAAVPAIAAMYKDTTDRATYKALP